MMKDLQIKSIQKWINEYEIALLSEQDSSKIDFLTREIANYKKELAKLTASTEVQENISMKYIKGLK